MTSSTFIDWMNVSQRHLAADLPIVGDGVRINGAEFEQIEHGGRNWLIVTPHSDGVKYSIPSKQARGSHDTSLRVRCDGSTVTLSGNVGRWERPDNVWNYDLDDTVALASQFVAAYGLPAFSAGECRAKSDVSAHDAEIGLWTEWTGAVFRELHVTRNFYVGSEPMAVECMRYMGGHRAARIAKGVFGDETIQFGKRGGKLHKRVVVYRKAQEMLAHAKGEEAKKRVKASQEYQMARDMGLIRIECKWGSDFLRNNGLRFMGDATMAKVISLFEAETSFLRDCDPDRAVRVVSEMPAKLRAAALLWIDGRDLREVFSRATYFRHVKALRDYGIDASEPRDASAKGSEELQRLLDALPRFELRELPAPEWYGLPDVSRVAA